MNKSYKTLQRLFTYLKNYQRRVLLTLLVTFLIIACDVVAPKITGNITNTIATTVQAGQSINFSNLIKTLLILALIYVIWSGLTWVQSRFLADISITITRDIREELSHKIKKIPLSFYDTKLTGDLLSRITNDVETISQNIQFLISKVFYGATLIIATLVMMFRISLVLTLIFLITIPTSMIITNYISRRSQVYFRAKSKGLGKMVGYVEESFTGVDLVKAYNYEDRADREFSQINEDLFQVSYKASFMAGILGPILVFISNLGYVLLAVAGGILVVRRDIMIGDVLTFIQYSRQITRPINDIATMANNIQETIAACERIFEFMDAPEEVDQAKTYIQAPVESVEFSEVNFSYQENTPVINNFSLKVEKGQTIAIVGPTGAGKTTLINLLLRFYDVNSGSIKINGVDIRDVSRENLRSLFGMVLQETWLIQGSVKDNIRYGDLTKSDEDVYQAAQQAYCHHFIEQLPNGYDTILNEDASNISQGQRQLLTIARALISDPEILILDEATSSVDTRTEQMIQKAMNKLMEGRTNFVIAHRLSTIVGADSILVLDKGDIVEQGSHQELLKKGGLYKQLYESQFVEQ